MEIVCYPAAILREKGEKVGKIDNDIRSTIRDMFEIMYNERGVGLAAPQVGLRKRIIVINVDGNANGELVLINPHIIHSSGTTYEREGCLSLPGIDAFVTRKAQVVIRAMNEKGKKIEIEAADLLARTAQHEIDHIDGVLFIDRLSPANKLLIEGQLKELESQYKNTLNSSK